jgi:hypothetical protein
MVRQCAVLWFQPFTENNLQADALSPDVCDGSWLDLALDVLCAPVLELEHLVQCPELVRAVPPEVGIVAVVMIRASEIAAFACNSVSLPVSSIVAMLDSVLSLLRFDKLQQSQTKCGSLRCLPFCSSLHHWLIFLGHVAAGLMTGRKTCSTVMRCDCVGRVHFAGGSLTSIDGPCSVVILTSIVLGRQGHRPWLLVVVSICWTF